MLRILTYHRIADPASDPQLNPRLISATPEMFASHIHFLASHYRVLGLEDVLVAFETGRQLPRRAVLITFDDAYRDFMDVAWPILQAHRLPATVFVPTAYPGRPERAFWWDRLHRCCTDPGRPELVLPSLGALPLRTREERSTTLREAIREVKKLPHDRGMTLVEEICDQIGVIVNGRIGLTEEPLFFGSALLTAFNDNALITYLATLVPSLDDPSKLAVVQGAVVGGGLTVIANAPNPAGQALLGRFFGGAIVPACLLAGALLPTVIAGVIFRLL